VDSSRIMKGLSVIRRRAGLLAPFFLLLTLLALAACGSQGYAPALGKAATTPLSGSQPASLTLTPIYATHVVVYYLAKLVPYADAKTPVELRKGSCAGETLAALTQATATPAPASAAAVAPNTAAKGVDAALTVDENVYVVILDHANDPKAQILACGAPLSSRRQYFDLFTPGQGTNGTQLGIALIEPEAATRAQVRLTSAATTALTWAIYAGGCASPALASGEIAQGATEGGGVIFQTAPTTGWSASFAPVNAVAPGACQKVKG
jgi:hypothetical protein